MAGFQAIHLVLMLATSIKLAKQLVHQTASGNFLVQSYLSTVLAYAGIYALLYRIRPDVWTGMDSDYSNRDAMESFNQVGYSVDSHVIVLTSFASFASLASPFAASAHLPLHIFRHRRCFVRFAAPALSFIPLPFVRRRSLSC